jgi:hypothetical protein
MLDSSTTGPLGIDGDGIVGSMNFDEAKTRLMQASPHARSLAQDRAGLHIVRARAPRAGRYLYPDCTLLLGTSYLPQDKRVRQRVRAR